MEIPLPVRTHRQAANVHAVLLRLGSIIKWKRFSAAGQEACHKRWGNKPKLGEKGHATAAAQKEGLSAAG